MAAATLNQPDTYSGELPSAAMKEKVQAYMKDRGYVPNSDNTLRMVKVVDEDYTTRGVSYAVGSVVVAPDYKPHAQCGNGLHFCGTESECKEIMGDKPVVLVVDVDLESAVVIYGSGPPKIKARWCRVVRDGNEMDFFFAPEWE